MLPIQIQWSSSIASILSFFLSLGAVFAIFRWWRYHVKEREYWAIYGDLRRASKRPIIVLPEHGTDPESGGSIITLEEALALASFLAVISKHELEANCAFHREVTGAARHGNLILISGPVGNSVLDTFLKDAQHFPLVFNKSGDGEWSIYERDTVGNLSLMHPPLNESTEDYGIIAKWPNPWHRGSTVFVVSGLGVLGTLGCAYQFAERYRSITARLKAEFAEKTSHFAAIVRVRKCAESKPETMVLSLFPHARVGTDSQPTSE